MLKAKQLPSREYLFECFIVNLDGSLTWKPRPIHHFKNDASMKTFNTRYSGKKAGRLHKFGYVDVSICKSRYKAHRVIFSMIVGEIPDGIEIDHKDGVRSNNRPSNLRLATYQQNRYNLKTHSDSASKFKGITWHKQSEKWRARIGANGRSICIGYFNSIESAFYALSNARIKYHGNFANNGIHTGEIK